MGVVGGQPPVDSRCWLTYYCQASVTGGQSAVLTE